MSGNDHILGSALTEAERLQLLQLLTRDAMARRLAAKQDDLLEKLGDGSAAGSQAGPNAMPARWRLVPDGWSPFAWQSECLDVWLRECRGTIKVATGAGKTLFALAAAERLQHERDSELRLVIVVPTIPLLHQWHDDLVQSNVPSDAIALMGGGYDIDDPATTRIAVCVLASARDRLPKLAQRGCWGPHLMLVVDECHRANAEEARRIFESHPRYTLGLSATPEQEGEAEDLPSDEAYAASPVGVGLGPIIYEYSLKRALADGLLTPFQVWHIGLSLSEPEAKEHLRLSREIADLRRQLQARYRQSRSKGGFLPWCQAVAARGGSAAADAERFIGLSNRRKRLLYRAEARSQITRSILRDAAAKPDGRTIVFHESIDEIERLFLRSLDDGVPAVLEHSQLPERIRADNIEAFRSGVARVIVSAKSLVEGFNVPSADLGIIVASSGSVRQRIQSLGRLLRRKEGRNQARVVVLYVRDTQDEEIYRSADWEQVVGVGRNNYYHWQGVDTLDDWDVGLRAQPGPPRAYRPPSHEVEVTGLAAGDAYPGRADGVDLRVDAAESLRTTDGRMIPAPPDVVRQVVDRSPHRRAHRTAAGHLVVRVDDSGARQEAWVFLGAIPEPEETSTGAAVRYRLKRSQGRRHVTRLGAAGRTSFALGPGRARDESAADALTALLTWIADIERAERVSLVDLFWDGTSKYWLEVRGARVAYPQALPALEFAS